MTLMRVLVTEALKLRRSRITWISWLAISIMPLVAGLFMWIIMEPDRAMRLGLLGQKAQFVGASASWEGFAAMLLQTVGIGGMILISVIAAYVFGREFSDGTVKNLLLLPIPRHDFVFAKLLIVLAWFFLLIVSFLGEAWIVGSLLALPGYSAATVISALGDILLTSLVAFLLVPPVAYIALLGKGYFAPLGFTVFMLVMGMSIGTTGWGMWFPWSIVPLFAGVAGPRAETLSNGSIVVLFLTFAASLAVACLHLRYADNTQ
jgi:ABC-2 type transport system permease protein